jgi:hypothetical protein
MADKTIVRVVKNKDNPYVMLNKGFLNDDRMSWRAKGLLAYLLSKPDDWEVMICDLVAKSTEGKNIVYNTLKELINIGYIERNKLRDSKGKITKWEYRVYEYPLSKKPEVDNQEMANPDVDNQPLLNNDRLLITEGTNQSDRFDTIDDLLKHYSSKYNLPYVRVLSVYDRVKDQYKSGNVQKFTAYFEAALEQEKIDYEHNKFIDI